MKKSILKWVAAAAIVAAMMPMLGLAQDGRTINQREREQQQRIRQGVRSGELTRAEARRLEIQQGRIRRDEARARRSGGEFTARERARIQRELNHSNRNIYRQKHDRQDRNW